MISTYNEQFRQSTIPYLSEADQPKLSALIEAANTHGIDLQDALYYENVWSWLGQRTVSDVKSKQTMELLREAATEYHKKKMRRRSSFIGYL